MGTKVILASIAVLLVGLVTEPAAFSQFSPFSHNTVHAQTLTDGDGSPVITDIAMFEHVENIHKGNQAPQILGEHTVDYAENGNAPVGEYTARDQDGDAITWSLLGYDREKFTISEMGVLSFRSPPDYEQSRRKGRQHLLGDSAGRRRR